MTPGTIDQLRIGQVLNYVYLFLADANEGHIEGVKERPVIVIDLDIPNNRVAVMAVTTKGDPRTGAVPIPHEVARVSNLSPHSSIVASEFNSFQWVGYDIRPYANGYVIGRLPPGFTAKIRALAASAKGISRD